MRRSVGTLRRLRGVVFSMPSSHHDLLILEVERTRQVALATGIARTGTGAPNLLLAASLATGAGATDEPTAVWLLPYFGFEHIDSRVG